MRTFVLVAVVALATAGCATVNRAGGESGATVVSDPQSPSSESGAAYDNIATSGSNPSEPTGPVH